jgi:hypothetical protein
MRMLFENIARTQLSKERIHKYEAWLENTSRARKSRSLGSRDNQYDKAEELITFYTFAPLELREDRREVVQQILSLGGIMEHVEEPLTLAFERQLSPPKGYLEWLAREVSKHPIRYVREQGSEHAKAGKPLETNTHVDVVLEAKNLLLQSSTERRADSTTTNSKNTLISKRSRMTSVGENP